VTDFGLRLVRAYSVLALVLVPLGAAAARADEPPPARPTPKAIAGTWQGALKVGTVDVRLVIHLTEKPGGLYSGTLDAPDAGRKGVPVDTITCRGDSVRLELKGVPASFEGRLNEDGSEIAGTWKQGGQSFPVTFRRPGKAPAVQINRPQEPKKPYPYAEEEVAFDNKKGGVRLAGTLTRPKAGGPFPAVLLLTGSGPQDRDETLFGHRPFLVLADYLTRRGLAVLRVDDRGVGKSTGSFEKATVEDFAGDARAGLEYLKGRKDIDGQRIGLLGHSEGGTVASLVASRSPDVAFLILMASPGLTGEELWCSQAALMLKADGATEGQVAKSRRLQERLVAVLRREKDDGAAEKELRRVLAAEVAALSEEDKRAAGNLRDLADAQVKALLSPSFRFNLAYDPRPTLRKVRCPVLAINGERDIVVACAENLAAIEAALKAGGNTRYTVKALPALNHLFQTCKTGSFAECPKIEETIAPAALELIGKWALKQTDRK
jgi:pimeloyl-ACP methyl ester carboxylesterase